MKGGDECCDPYWYDLRWKTWQAGLYDLLVEAWSNFFDAASLSSKLFWRKNLIHQEELLNLACTELNILYCHFLCSQLCKFPHRNWRSNTKLSESYHCHGTDNCNNPHGARFPFFLINNLWSNSPNIYQTRKKKTKINFTKQ